MGSVVVLAEDAHALRQKLVNSLRRQWGHHVVGVPAGQHVQRGRSSLRFGVGVGGKSVGGAGVGGINGGGGGDVGGSGGGSGGGGIAGSNGGGVVVAVGVCGGFSVQENLLYIESKTVHIHRL